MATNNNCPNNDITTRLRRIEGQIRGIAKMIEEDRQCEDVVTQLLAARAAMDRVTVEILSLHVDDCLSQLPPADARTMISRAVQLFHRI